jgi:ribosomal protein S20
MAAVSIRNVDGLDIDTVYGDFAGRNVNGSASLKTVMGDISLRTVGEGVTIGKGHRDVNLRNLGGVNKVEMTHGDIRLRGGLAAGKHVFKANGDIVVRWPMDAPLNVEATAPSMRSRLSFDKVIEEGNHLTGRIGDGETFLFLEAQGHINLKELKTPKDSWDSGGSFDFDFVADLEGLGDQINAEISSRMRQLSARLEQDVGPDFSAKLERKAQEAAVKAEKAAEKAMRHAEKAAKKAGWQARGTAWDPYAKTSKNKSTKEKKATEEEQIKILKMVEKGIISPEEANTLLEAIGT